MNKKTKSERRESTKKRRSIKYKVHSRTLGRIYQQEVKKRDA